MKNPMSLAGRNILVTGAGQGIGAAIVRLAHDLGAQVIALDIKEEGIAALKDELGERIDTLVGSTADPDFVQSAVDETVARHGAFGQINYGAAKSGVMGMTMSAAREWSSKGIRINTVCFGVVETPMTEVIRGEKFRDGVMAQIPMGRFSTPEEVSQPVCFLLSEAASYITGQHLSVNGGYTIGV